MKKINIKIYSKRKYSKIGDFIKNVFLESNLIVESIDNFEDLMNTDSYIDCLFINFSGEDDIISEEELSKLRDLNINSKLSSIFYISDKDIPLPPFVRVILTKNLNKEMLTNILNDMLTSFNLNSIQTMTRSRSIVINNLCNDGFSTRHNGTIMLVDAILRAIMNRKLVINLRKDIYPYLMQKYGISNSCVELSITKAINHAYSKICLPQFSGIPTNKELLTYKICELYDYIADVL